MGLLNRDDSLIYRSYFREMCKLIGISVGYQYIVKKEMTIHSEDNSEFSQPIRIDILFDENPSVKTLNTLGWVSESMEEKPVIVNLPYNTPKLTVNARIIVESTDGTKRPRVFKVTKIKSDLEFPDAYTCAVVPVFDQYKQKNQYTLVNYEKLNTEESERTSQDQPYKYITQNEGVDTSPEEHINYENTFSYINDQDSPFSRIDMLIIQFQFSEVDNDEEYNLIPGFCKWICEQMYQKLDTKINRRKIHLRISYLYNVNWINWTSKTKFLDVQTVMDTIRNSFTYEQYRKNIWKIRTDDMIEIPGTHTSIDRLIRFLDFGDRNTPGTGMFNKLKGEYGFQNLGNLWKLYCLDNIGELSETQIISNR